MHLHTYFFLITNNMKLQKITERKKELQERSGINRKEHSREHSRASLKIPSHVIARIPTYYRYFFGLNKKKVQHITAKDISIVTGYSISIIKQDFSYFGNTGIQGVGYNVSFVAEYLRRLVGLEEQKNVIIIGAGRLGMALADYEVFGGRNICTVALFDVNSSVIDNKRVFNINELENFVSTNHVDIGIIAVPRQYVVGIYELLIKVGINNVLNLSDVYLAPKDDTLVKQSDISLSLMELICGRYNLENDSENKNQ